jgi:hypothetical protein
MSTINMTYLIMFLDKTAVNTINSIQINSKNREIASLINFNYKPLTLKK